MRFSYCEGLVEKKSFYIYSVEYFYENELNSFFLKQYNLSKFFFFFCYMLFELHNSYLNINKSLLTIGRLRSRNFARLLLWFFQPHINIKNYLFFNTLRLLKPLTLKGLNLIRGLPMRGQRTHSNSKNILRFQSYFSSYILTIPRTNFYEYYSSIKEASLEQKLIQEKPKKKKKDKSKSKTTKNKKKIKKDIWK
jgi:hypothetical protein